VSEEPSSLTFQTLSTDVGKRLDAFLAEKIDGWSRSRLQRLIDDEDVLVNEKPAKSSYKLRENDEIEVELTEIPTAKFEPENIPLDIVFEDEYLAVVNKPAGMVVHPGAGVQSGTLANAIAYHFGLKSSPPYEGGVAGFSSPPGLRRGADASSAGWSADEVVDEPGSRTSSIEINHCGVARKITGFLHRQQCGYRC